jgi:hypothetical protein
MKQINYTLNFPPACSAYAQALEQVALSQAGSFATFHNPHRSYPATSDFVLPPCKALIKKEI